MSICVVAIHTQPLSVFNDGIVKSIYEAVIALAVPFYFCVSGFLLAQGMELEYSKEKKLLRISKQLLRLLQTYIIWSIIYLPLTIYGYIQDGSDYIKCVALYFRNILFQGDNFFSWHLWYLLSSIYVFIAIYFLYVFSKDYKNQRALITVFVFSFVLYYLVAYLLGKSSDNYLICLIGKIIEKTIRTNRIFAGGVFIPIGAFVYYLKNKSFLFNKAICFVCILFALIVYILLGGSLVARIFACFFLLSIAVQVKKIFKTMYMQIRHSGMVIYLTHMYFFFLWDVTHGMNGYGIYGFLFTIICSLILSIVVNILYDRYKVVRLLFG